MNDLISRRAAIKAIDDLPNCYNGYSDTYDKACIIGVLEELPTIEPLIIDDGNESRLMTSCDLTEIVKGAYEKGFTEGKEDIERIKCGECIHHDAEISLCYYHNMPTTEGWFCADGERLEK